MKQPPKSNRTFPSSIYSLALVYHRLNNVSGATPALSSYKELEPSDEEIELVDQLLKAMETGRPAN